MGVGWNHIEYGSLGMDWETRGARQAEQVAVLRRLWTENLDDRFHESCHNGGIHLDFRIPI